MDSWSVVGSDKIVVIAPEVGDGITRQVDAIKGVALDAIWSAEGGHLDQRVVHRYQTDAAVVLDDDVSLEDAGTAVPANGAEAAIAGVGAGSPPVAFR